MKDRHDRFKVFFCPTEKLYAVVHIAFNEEEFRYLISDTEAKGTDLLACWIEAPKKFKIGRFVFLKSRLSPRIVVHETVHAATSFVNLKLNTKITEQEARKDGFPEFMLREEYIIDETRATVAEYLFWQIGKRLWPDFVNGEFS